MSFCILGLLLRPEVLKRAQEEMDNILLPGHFPTFDDEDALPVVSAIVKETFRWGVITPFGMTNLYIYIVLALTFIAVPHYIHVDDQYRGYHIPAKSIVLPNVWYRFINFIGYPDR